MTLGSGERIKVDADAITAGLKYSPSFGLPGLCDKLKAQITRDHSGTPFLHETDEWNVCVSTGSQDALAKTFDMLLDERDSLLIENPTYWYVIAASLAVYLLQSYAL